MCLRLGRFVFPALMCAMLAAPTFAAPADKPKLKVANRIVVAPIRADEIVPGAPSVSAGSTAATLDWAGGRLSANLVPPDAAGVMPYIVRPLVGLWSLKFTPNDDKPLGFVVSYTLTNPSGAANSLGSTTQPGASLTATVIDLPPRIDVRQNGMMDVTGDAELRIDTSSVGISGQYVGDLLITVNYL
jgi:hypothetical protein